jgi:hypothetical protein
MLPRVDSDGRVFALKPSDNAARQRGGMRVPNSALLIWSKVGPLC